LALAQVRPFAKIEQPFRRAFAEPRTTSIAVVLLGIDGRECPEGFLSARTSIDPSSDRRKATGSRMHGDQLSAIDKWREAHDVGCRPEAIRRLVELGLR
jgi:hypothetical protein